MEETLIKMLKNLYRAQFTVLDSYKELAEDERFTEDDRDDIQTIMKDHEEHKERLGMLIEELGEKRPDTTGKIAKWGHDITEVFGKDGSRYASFQKNLSAERLLIDLYDIAAVFAHDNEKVLMVIDQNADQDVEHADFFKDGVLGFAEEEMEEMMGEEDDEGYEEK